MGGEARRSGPGGDRLAFAVFALAFALYAAARLWRLDAYSLRPDEIFSLQTARLGIFDLIAAAVRDVVHPPLFYLALHAWIAIGGDGEGWLRLLPVLFALATPIPFLLLGRTLGLSWTAITLGTLLMAVNAYLIYFAQELRMYSLFPLLTLTSLWLACRYKDGDGDRSRLLALFVVNLLLIYTHYFGWLVLAGEALILAVDRRERLRAFLYSCAALALLFAPWAWLVTRASLARGGLGSSIGSFARPDVAGLGGYYALVTGTVDSSMITALGITLITVPALLLALRFAAWRARLDAKDEAHAQRLAFATLALFATMPVLVPFAFSLVLPQSIWGTRMLTFAAPPCLLLIAMGFAALRPDVLRWTAIVLVVVYSANAGWHGLQHSNRNDWRPLVKQMIAAEKSEEPSIVVYAFGSMDEVIAHYAANAGDKRFVTRRVRDVRAIEGDRFWVAFRRGAQADPIEALRVAGYRAGEPLRDGYGAVLVPIALPGSARTVAAL